MDPVLKDVMDSEHAFVSDMQLWREYEAREKAIKDEKSHLLTARMEGIYEAALRLLKKGHTPESVAADLELPLEQVLKLVKK